MLATSALPQCVRMQLLLRWEGCVWRDFCGSRTPRSLRTRPANGSSSYSPQSRLRSGASRFRRHAGSRATLLLRRPWRKQQIKKVKRTAQTLRMTAAPLSAQVRLQQRAPRPMWKSLRRDALGTRSRSPRSGRCSPRSTVRNSQRKATRSLVRIRQSSSAAGRSTSSEAGEDATSTPSMASLLTSAWRRRPPWHVPTSASSAGAITRIQWEPNGNGRWILLIRLWPKASISIGG
mmetsp:Transcript_81141/g.194690  ORF Transcript_81141/g.194690 Transcript_81141/m.194690 type:complete len:234 (+) Transcript_81141:584-1285(+)